MYYGAMSVDEVKTTEAPEQFISVKLPGQPSLCRDCGGDVRWVRTRQGKKMPLDMWSSRWGKFSITSHDDGVPVVSFIPKGSDLTRLVDPNLYRSHFDTCKKNHRRVDEKANAPKPVVHTQRFLDGAA